MRDKSFTEFSHQGEVSVSVCSLDKTDDLCPLRGMSRGLLSVARADACPCSVIQAVESPDAFLKLLPWESVFWA